MKLIFLKKTSFSFKFTYRIRYKKDPRFQGGKQNNNHHFINFETSGFLIFSFSLNHIQFQKHLFYYWLRHDLLKITKENNTMTSFFKKI